MANHVRKQIRDAAVLALTNLTTTGSRVYGSRIYPMQDANLPGLRVDTNNERDEVLQFTPSPTLERKLELVVQACVKQNDTYNDVIDQVVKEVEVAIAANQSLGGAKYVHLKQIEIEMAGEGEKPVAVATMTFEVPYYTAAAAPDVAT